MITERSFIVPIYDFKIEVAVFDSLKEAQAKFPEFMAEGTKACTVEYFHAAKVKLIVPSYRYSTVVHELEHTKNLLWKSKGHKPQEDNDEVDAYLIEYLYDKVDKIIRKHLATQC
jgi:hypothetical protein